MNDDLLPGEDADAEDEDSEGGRGDGDVGFDRKTFEKFKNQLSSSSDGVDDDADAGVNGDRAEGHHGHWRQTTDQQRQHLQQKMLLSQQAVAQ